MPSNDSWRAALLRWFSAPGEGPGGGLGAERTRDAARDAQGSEREDESRNPLLGREDPSPHVAARSEFNNRFYDLAKARRNAQIMAFAALGLAAFLAVAYVRLASTTQITPYVVEVNELGVARAFGPALPAGEDERITTASIGQFIRNARRITSDPQAQRELVVEAYAYADQNARSFLDDYFSRPENDPRLLSQRLRRTVHLESILKMPSGDAPEAGKEAGSSWQVRWTEREMPVGGSSPTASAWEAVLRVRQRLPTSVESVTVNPIGVYVTDINWGVVNEAPTSEARLSLQDQDRIGLP